MHVIIKGCSLKDLGNNLWKRKAGLLFQRKTAATHRDSISQSFFQNRTAESPRHKQPLAQLGTQQLPSAMSPAKQGPSFHSFTPLTALLLLLPPTVNSHTAKRTQSSVLKSITANIQPHCDQKMNWGCRSACDCFPVTTDGWPAHAQWDLRVLKKNAKAHCICSWNSTQYDGACGREFFKFLSMSGL